jgi:excisionase family DNA binding protein
MIKKSDSVGDTMNEMVSLAEAAKALGVTTKTLRNWDAAGKIQLVRTVGQHRRVPIEEVERLKMPDGVKWCGKCDEAKASDAFNENRKVCKSCIAAQNAKRYQEHKDTILAQHKEWRDNNKEKLTAYHAQHYQENKDSIKLSHQQWRDENKDKKAEWRRNNPDKNKQYCKDYYADNARKVCDQQRFKKYNITQEQYNLLLKTQEEACAICRSKTAGGQGTWHIDHDHVTGAIRGLLCTQCNTMIGLAKDDPQRLLAAIEYLCNPVGCILAE